MSDLSKIIVIMGTNASGKSGLGVTLAEHYGGEIVSADSRQVFRGLDLGSGKITPEETRGVPHHLIDVCDPGDFFSMHDFQRLAYEAIDGILARGRLPFLVGGTGLYLQSLSVPMDFGAVGGDEQIREKYHRIADTQGREALHALLEKADPASAARLHPNDVRRVVRALEVYELTGVPLSSQKMPGPEDAPYDFQLYALDLPRDELYARVDKRVDEMVGNGLLKEVERLRRGGLSPDAQSMQGLGYKELWPVLTGETRLEDAVSLMKLRTRHFAKRQLTWFKRDERIQWLPWQVGDGMETLVNLICERYLEQ